MVLLLLVRLLDIKHKTAAIILPEEEATPHQ